MAANIGRLFLCENQELSIICCREGRDDLSLKKEDSSEPGKEGF